MVADLHLCRRQYLEYDRMFSSVGDRLTDSELVVMYAMCNLHDVTWLV